MTGVKGGYDVDLRRYPEQGVMLLGHLQGYHDGRLLLASDLQKTLAEGDETLVAFRKMADDYVTEAGIDAPDDKSQPDAGSASTIPSGSMRELHLQQAGIGSVVWATGSRCDFRWIHFPIFDEDGEPAHRRGVTSIPGLYFLGLQWLYKRKSAFFWGIAEDAAYLAEHIAARM
jgi:putative flavoprotein involved in K+ transport